MVIMFDDLTLIFPRLRQFTFKRCNLMSCDECHLSLVMSINVAVL